MSCFEKLSRNWMYTSVIRSLTDIFGKKSAILTGVHKFSTQRLCFDVDILIRCRQFLVRRWHTLDALFTQSLTLIQSLLCYLPVESEIIRWNLIQVSNQLYRRLLATGYRGTHDLSIIIILFILLKKKFVKKFFPQILIVSDNLKKRIKNKKKNSQVAFF